MRNFYFVLVIGVSILSFFSTQDSWAYSSKRSDATTTQCHSYSQPLPWKVCVTTTASSANQDVLYYLHGAGGNERQWADDRTYFESIRKAWRRDQVAAPRVVAISFGERWLLAEKNQSPLSGLFDLFTDQIMPQIEKELGTPSTRTVFGISMGGFNATQLLLKKPNLFKKVVLGCPAIANLAIDASTVELSEYAIRTGADLSLVKNSLELAQRFFPDKESWASASPIAQAKSQLSSNSPAVHISCGNNDEYGFYEGAELFAQIAKTNGVTPLVWQTLTGGHCVLDPESIAKFLSP